MDKAFHDAMAAGYALTEPGLVLGSPMVDGELANDARVQVALSMLNRHGLIAGATGTGKTKTLQLMAGQLSKAGVPVFVADIKGDLTGLAAPGDATNPKVVERVASLGWTFQPSGHPVEYLSLTGKLGAQVRATVHSFGPLLLGKVLDLNETQTSILALIFKYCDDNDLPLLDLKDLEATLKYLASDEGKPILAEYGGMSTASVGVLLRSMIVLEQEGADIFFGEPEFEVEDLLRATPEGEGIISILELSDVGVDPEIVRPASRLLRGELHHPIVDGEEQGSVERQARGRGVPVLATGRRRLEVEVAVAGCEVIHHLGSLLVVDHEPGAVDLEGAELDDVVPTGRAHWRDPATSEDIARAWARCSISLPHQYPTASPVMRTTAQIKPPRMGIPFTSQSATRSLNATLSAFSARSSAATARASASSIALSRYGLTRSRRGPA